MAVIDQHLGDQFALYNGDCIEVMRSLPAESVHLSVYSPPFGGLYHYSSSDHDLSNCRSYEEFFEHYGYVVQQLHRVTVPGRMTAVHCMEVPRSNSGTDSLIDFPGDIIRLHEGLGWEYTGRHVIWKEPLAVRLRTMQKNLAHATVIADSVDCGVASADNLLFFRRSGKNPIPVQHPKGLLEYAGDRRPPAEVMSYRGWTKKQTGNRYSQWIWRQYADCMWDDIRIDRVLPYKAARDPDDEKHIHPLQLDVIDRAIVLRSNPGETILTPFAGVGSEVYAAIVAGRRAIGIELKPSYYRQMVRNADAAAQGYRFDRQSEELAFDGEQI